MNIYEVAKLAGVSIATVSRVINNSSGVKPETRLKVEAALKKLNYRPNAIARSLVVNATHTIGVLAADVRDSYYANAIYTLEQEFRKLGYHVILCNTGGELEKRKRYLGLLLEKKVDGIILVGSIFKEKSGNGYILEAAASVPVVMLNSHIEGDNIYSVVCDDCLATEQIVSVLYAQGHRDIIYAYDVDSFSGMAKLEGFKAGMARFNLPVLPHTIMKTDVGIDGGYKCVQTLIEHNISFTALVASEDILAAGILKGLALFEKKIPEDVSVFGYNNSLIAESTNPTLSSVENKVVDLSKEAVKMLYGVLNNQEPVKNKTILPELVFRESCPIV